jgi:hypothetical protein
MRHAVSAIAALAAVILAFDAAGAQERFDLAGGLMPGDYLRIGLGSTMPVNPQGSLANWGTGTGVSVGYENWQAGGAGVGRVGFGLTVAYSALPLKEQSFTSQFIPATGGTTTSATASKAGILEVASTIRFRIPAPVLSPAITVGFGFINWAPGTITYKATTGSGSVKQSHRSGAELTVGGSVDRQLWDRFAAYAEGAYVYGYTGYGRGYATPGGVCSTSGGGCDPLKNTTVAVLRGGLRVRITDR